ncbi:MAG: putative lipid II flippase FtsW [Gammaproteobacteria bacterium]|nr:putative lipid II flippase FtsW [Gammaproteobacteria bacterium]
MSAQTLPRQSQARGRGADVRHTFGMNAHDVLLLATAVLVGLGVVMVASASLETAERQFGVASYFVIRQLIYVILGLAIGAVVYRVPIEFWERRSVPPLFLAMLMLLLVLIPGIGREINGSMRWVPLGFANLQPSELAKLAVTIYLAGYLVRRSDEVRHAFMGFVKPIMVLAVLCVLLILEPDFGSVAVMLAIALAMLFIGGVRLWQFTVMMSVVSAIMALLAVSSPYRLQRITAFMDPWADPFASGFQLTQALIAFGRGEWLGVGLGNSIQKLFYLPEAHTDFLFSVLAEELGLAGVVAVLGLFLVVVGCAFAIARQCERQGRPFAAYLAFGIGTWIGIQAMANMAVNMGLLPTKGLTLPLMSYGGSSLVVMCAAIALLLRIAREGLPAPRAKT